MRRIVMILVAGVLTVACSEGRRVVTGDAAFIADHRSAGEDAFIADHPAIADGPAKTRDPLVGVLFLAQESLLPGSTGAGANPALRLRALDIGKSTATQIATRLEHNVTFVDSASRTSFGVSLAIQSDGPDFLLIMNPVDALLLDRWYDVRCPPLENLAISSDDVYGLGENVVTRFYTGSAPQLRRLDLIQNPETKHRSLLVQMSEPVNASDLVGGGIGMAGITGCIMQGDHCLQEATDGAVLSGFEYGTNDDLPYYLEIGLALPLRGLARTVGAAFASGAVRGPCVIKDQVLSCGFDSTTWRQRRDPTRSGWSNAED